MHHLNKSPNFQHVLDLFSKLKLEEVYLKTVKGIRIDSSDNKTISLDLKTYFGRTSPPLIPNCRLLELNTNGVPKKLIIELRKMENMSFHMNIVERNMALTRRNQNSYAYNGPFLGIENLHKTGIVVFGLRVKQSHYSDKDVKTNCVNYPTTRFQSFRECDEGFTHEEMHKNGIMPFWAVKGKNNVSKSK